MKALRTEYKLTQSKLSELTGIPIRTIQNWDCGKCKPPAYVVDLIRFKLEHLKGQYSDTNS